MLILCIQSYHCCELPFVTAICIVLSQSELTDFYQRWHVVKKMEIQG